MSHAVLESMSNADDIAIIAKVRRAMPRNEDVMRICEIAEEAVTVRKLVDAVKLVDTVKWDKKAYQRDYMRHWRQRTKGKP